MKCIFKTVYTDRMTLAGNIYKKDIFKILNRWKYNVADKEIYAPNVLEIFNLTIYLVGPVSGGSSRVFGISIN